MGVLGFEVEQVALLYLVMEVHMAPLPLVDLALAIAPDVVPLVVLTAVAVLHLFGGVQGGM